MHQRALLHILLFVLEDEHLHALGLEFAQDLYVALEAVVEVVVGLGLELDQLNQRGQLVLLEVVHLLPVDEQVDGTAGGRDAAPRASVFEGLASCDWACERAEGHARGMVLLRWCILGGVVMVPIHAS